MSSYDLETIPYNEKVVDAFKKKHGDWSENGRRKNLKEFSKSHPDLIFCLECDLDEASNNIKEYYKDGKMQISYPYIAFEEFDESKLTD